MTSKRILAVLNAEPFRGFIIHLADGREVPVQHREFLALSGSGRTAAVFQPDDSLNIIDLLLVTDLEIKPQKRSKKNGNGRKKS